MKLRWKVEVKNFGADVGLKSDPVLQYEVEEGVWKDVPVVEVDVEDSK
jgi:hypothetical protein